jgi:hypothetical protein
VPTRDFAKTRLFHSLGCVAGGCRATATRPPPVESQSRISSPQGSQPVQAGVQPGLHGRPFGEESWREQTAKRLGLESRIIAKRGVPLECGSLPAIFWAMLIGLGDTMPSPTGFSGSCAMRANIAIYRIGLPAVSGVANWDAGKESNQIWRCFP